MGKRAVHQSDDDSQRWRLRAVEAHAVADQMSDPKNKSVMASIAAAYEHLAEHADQDAKVIEGVVLQIKQARRLAEMLDELAQVRATFPSDTAAK